MSTFRYWETIPRSKERAEMLRGFTRQAQLRAFDHEVGLTKLSEQRIFSLRQRMADIFEDAARSRTPQEVPSTPFNLRTPTLATGVREDGLRAGQEPADEIRSLSPANRRELTLFAGVRPELDAALARENIGLRDFLDLDEGDRARLLFPNEQPIFAAQRLREAITQATRDAPAILETPSGRRVEVPGEPGPLGVLAAADVVSAQIARQATGSIAAAGQIVNDLRRLKAPSRQELAALGPFLPGAAGVFSLEESSEAQLAEFERLPEGGPTVPILGKLSAKTVGETLLRPENLVFETKAVKGLLRVPFEPIGEALGRTIGRTAKAGRDLLGRTVLKPAPEAIVYADSAVRPPKPTDPLSTGVRDVQRQLAADIEFEPVMGLLDEAVVAPSPLPIDAQIAAVKTQLRQAEISPVLGAVEGAGVRAGRSSFDVQAEITRLTQRRTELRATAADKSVSAVGRRRAATEADGLANQLQKLRRELAPEVVQGVGPGSPIGTATTGRVKQLQAQLERLEGQKRLGAEPVMGQLEPGTLLTKREVAAGRRTAQARLEKDFEIVQGQLDDGILPRTAQRIEREAMRTGVEEDPMIWARDEFLTNGVIERMSAGLPDDLAEIGRMTTRSAESAVRVPTWLEKKLGPIGLRLANRRIFWDPKLQSGSIRHAADKEAGIVWAKARAAEFKDETLRLFGPTVKDSRLGPARLPAAARETLAPQVLRRGVADDKLMSQSIRYVGPKAGSRVDKLMIKTLPDIIEHRQWYAGLTPEQNAFLDDLQVFLREDLDLLRKAGAKVSDGDVEEYVAHIWNFPDRQSVPRNMLGAKQPMQGERTFADLRAGINAGFIPQSLDIGDLIEVRLAQSRKIHADQRFIDELRQMGSTVKPGEGALRGESFVKHGALRGRAYPEELARAIDDTLSPTGRGPLTEVLLAPADIVRAIVLSLDASAMIGIQGMMRFLQSPVGFLQDVKTGVRLISTKRGWQRELAMNGDRYIQAAADGVRFFNNATEIGQTRSVLKARVFGPLMWFNDVQFQRVVSFYKLQSYEANRAFLERVAAGRVEGKLLPSGLREKVAKRGPGPVAGDHVNNMFGGLDYSKIGTSSFQREVERFFLLAPDFFRSRTGLFSQALKAGSPEGLLADRFHLQVLAMAAGLTAVTSWATGEEANVTDCTRSDFLNIKTPAGDVPWLGSLGTYYKTICGVAGSLKDGNLNETEWRLKRFGRGRESIPIGLVHDLTLNEDFLGRPIVTKDDFVGKWEERLKFIGKSSAPIPAQALIEGFSGSKSEPGAFVEFLGIGFIPKSLTSKLDQAARKRFRKPYKELGRAEQQEIRGDPSLAGELQEFDNERRRKVQAGKASPVETVSFMLEDARQQFDQSTLFLETQELTPADWRFQYRQVRDQYGAAIQNLQRNSVYGAVFEKWNESEPKTERQASFRRWMQQFDLSRDPVTGILDGDALGVRLDRMEASLSGQELRDLQEDLGAKDPDAPMLAEWRQDVRQLSEYWDVTDDAMAELQRRGVVPRGIGSPSELKESLRRRIIEEAMRRNPTADPIAIAAEVNAELNADRDIREIEELVGVRRAQFLQLHPHVYRLLVKWGYREASLSRLGLIEAGIGQ